MGNLSELERLDLDDNDLTGPIPPQFGNLKKLNVLYLQGNSLSGTIPPQLGSLTKLRVLYLENNDLTGIIPTELGELTKLTQLILGENRLSGPVPEEVGNITTLKHLVLRDNQLTGQIPRTLSKLTFTNLGISGNSFTGCLPTGLDTAQAHDLWREELASLPTCGPTFDVDAYSFTVAADAAAGTTVGTVSATPYEASDQLTYTITDGNAAQLFSLDPSTGVITLTKKPTQDADDHYTLTLEAQDSHGQTSTVQVQVALNS